MGRDNQPRERQARKLARKKASRGAYPRILIVCEGEKTEPNYFEEIRREFRLHTANVHVLPSDAGTCPRQIVQFAEETFLKAGRKFDKIFAVFDRDDHLRFHEAVQLANSRNGKLRSDERVPVEFTAIPSIPCFELWLLLHFQRVAHRLYRTEVLKHLKTHLSGYEKGQGGHHASTRDRLGVAYLNASELAKLKESEGRDFPSTDIPILVTLLTTLKQ